MIRIREASVHDVEGILAVYEAEYGSHYAYPQYCDPDALTRLIYADGSVLLVAIDEESGRVAGTASVVLSIAAYNDLAGEFGRLVVHPDFRGRGIGRSLMEARLDRVRSRLHIGIVENRATHSFSQRISLRHGFVPVGFLPMKLLLQHRESASLYVQHFDDALSLRRNNPRIIPEAGPLASFALKNCGLPQDAIIDDTSPPFPHDADFELDDLKTEGYASLLRIERGRVRSRDIFGPVRLHYGMFQLQARHSHYLIARRQQQVVGGIGFMIDEAEKAVRVFELISSDDTPIRFLLQSLLDKCQTSYGVQFVEIEVSAYAPRMQRTLLELGFLPTCYVPASVFHEVERLDSVKMARLLIPFHVGHVDVCDEARPITEFVISSFQAGDVVPRLSAASLNTPLFLGLSKEQRQKLMAICDVQQFVAGERIFQPGETDGAMHLVLEGEVDVQTRDLRPIGKITPGQCLGESAVLLTADAAPTHSVHAVARTNVETAVLNQTDFHRLIRRRPDIGIVIYRNLAADVSRKLRANVESELP